MSTNLPVPSPHIYSLLDRVDSLESHRFEAESLLREAFLELALARSTMGYHFVSSSSIPDEIVSSRRVEFTSSCPFSFRLVSCESSDLSEKKETDCVTEEEEFVSKDPVLADCIVRSSDPLLWFGDVPAESLVRAQSLFRRALEVYVQVASEIGECHRLFSDHDESSS